MQDWFFWSKIIPGKSRRNKVESANRKAMLKNKAYIVAVYLLLLVLFLILYYTQNGAQWFSVESLDNYHRFAMDNFWLVSLILSGLMILFSVFGLPLVQFKILFGFFFGFWLGGIAGWIANTIAIFAHFLLTRYILYDYYQGKHKDKRYYKFMEGVAKENTFMKVVILRTSYVVPNNLINFYFSLFTKRPLDYMLGTFIGLLPTDLIDAFIGASLRDINSLFSNPRQLILIGILLVLYVLLIVYIQRKYFRKAASSGSTEA